VEKVMSEWQDQTERQRWRDEKVGQFLQKYGLVRASLSISALKCLDGWARQVQLVQMQPSASWGKVVLDLCRAVESELAAGLGSIAGLEFLSDQTALGDKANRLRRFTIDPSLKQRLQAKGFKPGAVLALQKKLSDLAALRRETDSAHGGAEIGEATQEHAEKAKHLAGIILRDLIPIHEGSKP
jgi:hypothetical protein